MVVGANKAKNAASGLGESINAVNVVFGGAAGKIIAFGKIAAREAGLSARAFNELVTPVGAALQNVGFSADDAADAAINLGKRAADMASVFNVDVEEAMGAIQAGLRGEADPLERFGVGLSDAAVTAHALGLGLADTASQLTPNAKAQARLSLLMEQTDRVAGDFKKTSGELANAQRINAAEAENATAKLGTGLLPVYEIFQGLLGSVTGFLGEHTTATTIVVGVVAGLAGAVLAVNAGLKIYSAGQAIATAATWLFSSSATAAGKSSRALALGTWLMNAALSANPLVLVVVGLLALGAALVIAWKKSKTFRDVVTGVWDAVKEAALTAVALILGGVSSFLGGLADMLDAASKIPVVGDKFKGLADDVRGAQDRVKDLQAEIRDLKGKKVRVTAEVSGLGSVAAMAEHLALINRNRNVKVKVGASGDGLIGAAGPSTVSQTLWDELGIANAMGLVLSSGYRPGAITSSGNPSLHGVYPSKAIDVAGPMASMVAFQRAVAGRSGVRELLGPLGGWYPSVGWTALSGALQSSHRDHVHVGSYDRGGFLAPGITIAQNLTGRPERVVSPAEAAETLDELRKQNSLLRRLIEVTAKGGDVYLDAARVGERLSRDLRP